MQKLHLVGFTPDHDGLILSTRKGAKSGGFVVAVDAAMLKQLAEAGASREPDAAARTNGTRAGHGPRQSRPESQLGPREMQELLRGGWSLEEVAAQASVDVDWVSRFAAPVLAEMRLVLDQARTFVFHKPRVGPSALPLAASVRRNAAERGVRFTDEDFDDAWRAAQLDDAIWIIGFDYTSRGKRQSAEWTVDLELGDIASRNRLGTQLGYVQSARRRIDTAPPPNPTPKAKAARATKRPAPARRAAVRTSTPAPRARARSSSGGKKATSSGTKARKSAKPHAAPITATSHLPASATVVHERPRHDPWREELRRRELERSAVEAARARAAAEPSEPRRAVAVAPAPRLQPVAIIGPTVRMLRRRPHPRPDQVTVTDDAPVADAIEEADEELPDLEWSVAGTKGPLPAPAPVAVPERVLEKVIEPIGSFDDDDDEDDLVDEGEDDVWSPPRPVTPVFRGAQAAAAPVPAPAVRRRRAEPLRAR